MIQRGDPPISTDRSLPNAAFVFIIIFFYHFIIFSIFFFFEYSNYDKDSALVFSKLIYPSSPQILSFSPFCPLLLSSSPDLSFYSLVLVYI